MELIKLLKFFLLFYFLTLTLSQESCPAKCICLRKAVRCLHQELTFIPKVAEDVQTLDVRFNKIYEIAPGIFSRLHRLRSLLLNDNRLQALRTGAFHGLRALKYLYLYRNRIQHIDPDVFQHLRHLEQLYLHVNEIHQIAPETFSNLPHLDRLYLHNNHLKSIPEGTFKGMPMLSKLRLDSNAFVCDCSMLWFVRMLAAPAHGDMKVAATCHAPDKLAGMPLSDMAEHHLHCKHPEIEKPPQDVIVNFGDNAVFSCMASGEPAPEIVWFRDDAALPLDATHYEVLTNGTLMVHRADKNDIGVFECMAKNPAGEVKSKPARMIIHTNPEEEAHPIFTLLPRKQLARLNQPFINFECVAKGIPKPHIIWLFNGERILLDERISLRNNGSIFIQNVQHSDAGRYTCQAENIHGVASAAAELVVMAAPVFTTVPTDQTTSVGDRVQFICKAKGSPKPKITWFRNTMDLPISDNIVQSDDHENLTLISVTADDDGLYHCRAENTEGYIEISAILKISDSNEGDKPKITIKPEDTDAFKETSVQLPCEVENDPSTEIEWRKDGFIIIATDRIGITDIGSLIINNVTLKDAGRYECFAFNEFGRDTASMFLTVKDRKLPSEEYVNIALTEATRDIDLAISRTMDDLFKGNDKIDIHDLFRIVRFPDAPAREVARAAEIYERALEKVKSFVQAGLNVSSTRSFNYNNVLSAELLEVMARLSGCVAHREPKNCSDMCHHKKYRSIDGSCNNFDFPHWGSSLTSFRRILYAEYENGFSQPRGWNKDRKYNGFTLPSARLVSTSVISTNIITEDIEITHMAMQWGQWLDHDLDHALPPVSAQSWDGVDCKKTCDYASPCFPIDVPLNDPRVTNRRCIDFIRTSAVCGSGMTSALFGKLQPREQINQLTSFIDASQVYGFEDSVARDLRDLTNENGLLRVGATFTGRKPSLPTVGLNSMDCRRNLEESGRNCYVAGDIRANEQIGLTAMHTIWMREHNRVALQLKTLNPFWSGDKVYQEARKIVGAEMQVITYEHWLPIVMGRQVHKHLGDYKGYNSNINPTISNVFATAALRFGHSMINPLLERFDENFESIPEGPIALRFAFFSPWRLVEQGGVDPLLRGMFSVPAKMKTSKQSLNVELTEQLFVSAHAVALDLAAINIQRGRDHGIPAYTKWRQFCNMSEVNTFDNLSDEISDGEVREKLKELYGSVHNIDVWVGGILEDQIDGGKVGPLFKCLLLEQFKRLRDGDRFWYENPTSFKPDQLQQIKKTTLARVLCDNGDNIDTISENVFVLPELQEGLVSCDAVPSMDLRFWIDCESCNDDDDDSLPSRARRRRDTGPREHDSLTTMTRLEESHNKLENIVELLKKRVEYLEDKCHKV